MKIKIDREQITLAKLDEAKEMTRNENWIDAETLKLCAARILKAHHGTESIYVESLLVPGELKVTLNHYQMTVWADGVTVEYSAGSNPKMAILAFDVLREVGEPTFPEAFIQVFDRSFCGTI